MTRSDGKHHAFACSKQSQWLSTHKFTRCLPAAALNLHVHLSRHKPVRQCLSLQMIPLPADALVKPHDRHSFPRPATMCQLASVPCTPTLLPLATGDAWQEERPLRKRSRAQVLLCAQDYVPAMHL